MSCAKYYSPPKMYLRQSINATCGGRTENGLTPYKVNFAKQ